MRSAWITCALSAFLTTAAGAQTPTLPAEIVAGRAALSSKDYAKAEAIFAAYAKAHSDNALAAMGEGDAALGLHQLEEAEIDYRRAVYIQPELWVAHKDLVLIEARLGRWSEFERERALLRGARERGAPNITKRESDQIDSFDVADKQWLVREYFEPVGRSEARYNFEHFNSAGHAEEYISLEPASAAASALNREAQVKIGEEAAPVKAKTWSLNWYTGKGHGTIKRYPAGEPKYETVRADVMRWLREKP
jgi:hypothetical protein